VQEVAGSLKSVRRNKFLMTRKFEKHPLLGTHQTTITYRLEPVANDTRVTVRDEGFVGRGEAAYGTQNIGNVSLNGLPIT
jgi:hypothetical protein